MKLQGTFDVNASREMVWERITDPALMAACIPGCQQIEEIDPKSYKAIVTVGIGVIKAQFDLVVEITNENRPSEVRSRTAGQEGGRTSQLSAENVVKLIVLDQENTRVEYESEVSISGRLGKFGLGVMRKYIEGIGDEFADSFRMRIAGPGATTESSDDKPVKSSKMARLLKYFGAGEKSEQPTVLVETATAKEQVNQKNNTNRSVLHPNSIDEAISMLVEQAASFPLAGGATLVAMKNAGLVQVSTFISLERIENLTGISQNSDGSIRIGAMTRHCETAASEILSGTLSVVREAAQSIANVPVRNMGTMGGSLANADPAADYLAALICVDAQVELAGPNGERTVDINDFLVDWYETALEHGEIIKAILLPPPSNGYSAYQKVARVSGDFAVASCAISVNSESSGDVISLAVGGCGPFPLRDRNAEQQLLGQQSDPQAVDKFSQKLVDIADPVDDVRGSAEYRLQLIPQLVQHAISNIPARGNTDV